MLYFLVYGQDKEKQAEFKNVMSFRGIVVSTCQLYKPLAEKHKCRKYSIDFKLEHRRILQIIVDADFVNSALLIFTRAKRGTYRPRAENVERHIRNNIADAYETS